MTQILMDFGSRLIIWILCLVLYSNNRFIEEELRRRSKLMYLEIDYLKNNQKGFQARIEKRIQGVINKTILKAKTAEVLADRSFNMASSANLAIMALQRTLTVRPTFVPRKKQLENEVAQKEVMKAVGGMPDYSGFDWLRPILGPDELDIIDKAMEHAEKFQNGEKEREDS